MTNINIGAVGLGLAAVLFFVAAILPLMRGRSLNAAFFAVAVCFFILAIAAGRKAPKPPSQN